MIIWICSASKVLRESFAQMLNEPEWVAVQEESIEKLNTFFAEFLHEFKNPGIVLLDARSIETGANISLCRKLCPLLLFLLISETRIPDEMLIKYLEAGIDDFIPYAINEKVLRARIWSYFRRILITSESRKNEEIITSSTGLISIDASRFHVTVKENNTDRQISVLTQTEFKILFLLVNYSGVLIERGKILQHVWGDRAKEVNIENVDKHVQSIRRKLGRAGEKIKTIHGIGYILYG